MPKFFISETDIINGRIQIASENFHHITKVLRLSSGDKVVFTDGNGKDYHTVIAKLDKNTLIAEILECTSNNSEPKVKVVLFQSMPKYDKMDFIIQKSVELGVAKVVPVITERSIARVPKGTDECKKISRWQKISQQAAMQCGRGIIPIIDLPMTYEKALKLMMSFKISIMPYEGETNMKICNCFQSFKHESVAIMIGPEGGFTTGEICLAKKCGIIPVSLGSRILRTETAGIVSLALVMNQFGEM